MIGRMRSPLQRIPLFFPLLLPFAATGQGQALDQALTLSVDVNLVVLHVTVLDRAGDFVPGLRKEHFRVWEDGRPQTILSCQHEDMPVSLGLIVDKSTSMARKRSDVTAAALAFVRSSNPQDQMFIVNFNERVFLGLPATTLFSASPAQLAGALNAVPTRGLTALYDAIEEGLAHLQGASRDKKVLIVVSDGGDDASRHTLAQVLDDARHSNVIIYTIGLFDELDRDRNPQVLRGIARATGGEAFFPREIDEVVPLCERIAADIRQQYAIGYESSNTRLDGTWRAVLVTAEAPRKGKLSARTRAGYFAAARQAAGVSPPERKP